MGTGRPSVHIWRYQKQHKFDGLVHAHLENTAKKQRCLAAYVDQGNACWDKVVEVVAGYPFYKKKLAKQIADKYGVTWQG